MHELIDFVPSRTFLQLPSQEPSTPPAQHRKGPATFMFRIFTSGNSSVSRALSLGMLSHFTFTVLVVKKQFLPN